MTNSKAEVTIQTELFTKQHNVVAQKASSDGHAGGACVW
jgi:hypothetical protein